MNLHTYLTPYLEYCLYRKELSPQTIKAYQIDLTQLLSHLGTSSPTRKDLEAYITQLHKSFKQKTVKRKIASVKAFYSYLEDQEILETGNPFHKIKVKFKEESVLPRIISRKDIEQLLNFMYANLHRTGGNENTLLLKDLAIIELLFATGARVYEISHLKKECVDLSSGLIRIMGKGKKERYTQIGDPRVLSLLNHYYESNQSAVQKCEYFFTNNRGQRYTEQSMRNMLKKHAEEAHIDSHITPHMFRHSLATYLIEEGVDITYVQKILGHSSLRTTQIYISIAAEKQNEILRHMHPRNKMTINDTLFS